MSPTVRLRSRERLADPQLKRELNEDLFGVVARRYDTVTRCLSLGRDRAWKAHLVAALPFLATPVCLDLACGTGDLSFRLAARYPDGQVLGLDLTEAMLEEARSRGALPNLNFRRGDLGRTGLAPASVDIATGGYALRNAGDLGEALAEVHRVLRPGGIGCFLDFAKPPGRALQRLEFLLLKAWGSLWGWIFHGDPEVYGYIAESLASFPDSRELAGLCRSQGFEVQGSTRHCFGIVQCLTLRKPGGAAPGPRDPEPS
jgi:demethylmenaquinone methyltransferase/2-methoxy-6-polyprenyl-1,4-benzoquinol methylase